MTQKTRRAVLYGAWRMTCSTRRSKGTMPVVGSQRPNTVARCTPGAAAHVLVLDAHRLAGLGGQARMDTQASLDAGLLVGRDHEFVLA
jgi:hypothetical protein